MTVGSKPSDAKNPSSAQSGPFLEVGKQQTEAMLRVQKELIDAYEQANRAWLERVKSEVDLWSELASKLAATRSVPEALQAYQACAMQRMQMAAEDARRLADECQAIMQKITRSLPDRWPTGST
jgi:hypothetical protein